VNVGVSHVHHHFVDLCIDYIDKYGIREQGLYRKCGSTNNIAKLKDLVESNHSLTHFETNIDVHDVAGCLKLFFRDMPQPLLTYELYDAFIGASEAMLKKNDYTIVAKVLRMLPFDNIYIFKKLILHLNKVHKYSVDNLMKSSNLAIVFAPSLLKSINESPETIIGDSKLSTYLFIRLIEDTITFF